MLPDGLGRLPAILWPPTPAIMLLTMRSRRCVVRVAAVAARIERYAVAMAKRIRAAFPTTDEANRARDEFCASNRPG